MQNRRVDKRTRIDSPPQKFCTACLAELPDMFWAPLGDGSVIHYGGHYADRCFRKLHHADSVQK